MLKPILYFAFAAASLSTPALAAERTADTHVAYADLQLASASGREALDRRISKAIDASCGVDDSSRQLAERRAAKGCVSAKHSEVAPARAAVLASYAGAERFAAATR